MFWSGFLNEQEDQAKKSPMNKKFSFVKRFKKELSDELVQGSVQENCSSHRFEDVSEALDDNLEKVLKNDEKEQRVVSNHKEKLGLAEKKLSFISIEESTTRFHVVAEMRNDTLQVYKVFFQRKALVQVKEVNWRPKTRVKNKLILNMKKILNPKLRKEKNIVIEDSTYEEMEEEEDLISQ